MALFIAKALIITICATAGYLVAAKVSLIWAKQFVVDYIDTLREEDVI